MMCRQKTEIFTPADFRIVSHGRNKYPARNALNGCVNDTLYFPQPLEAAFKPDVRRHYDYDVTVKKYLQRAEAAILTLDPGATVGIIADSCFSGTITRGNSLIGLFNKPTVRNRYYPNPKITPGIQRRSKVFESIEDRCILISGCQEHETSADAWFRNHNRYMGALSCGLMEAFENGMTWAEWVAEAARLMRRYGFEQHPNFMGPEHKKNEVIGSSQTLILHNSSHGSRLEDFSGDESDGYDETLYFDTHLPDDQISLFLDKIPA